MKKTLRVILVFMLVLLCYTTIANAATPSEKIMDYASKSIEINGQTLKLSSSDLLRVKKYLNQYPVTDESVADQIIAKGDQIIAILKTAGVTDPTKLPSDKKKQVLSIAQEAATLADAGLSYDSATKTAVITKDGSEFDRVSVSQSSLVQTGSDYTVYVCAATVAIIAIATITIVKIRKSKVNA